MNQHKAQECSDWAAGPSTHFMLTALTASVSIFCPAPLFMGGFQKCLRCDYCQTCIYTRAGMFPDYTGYEITPHKKKNVMEMVF